MTTIAITGATGFLGRNLLFEVLKQHQHRLYSLQLFILGRSSRKQSLKARIADVYREDGSSYLAAGQDTDANILAFFESPQVHYIETDLAAEEHIVADDGQFRTLKNALIDYFFHFAAMPDLRSTATAAEEVHRTNMQGTNKLLRLLAHLQVKEFAYVGTAYACGKVGGLIPPDYVNPAQPFRNPYEKSKLLAEMAVREFAARTGRKCRFFRPSIVAGRLMEAPLGHANKFDVFYEIFGFFYLEKFRLFGRLEGLDQTHVHLPIRAVFRPDGMENVVPVDYVAKLMYQICVQDAPGDSFYLVNEQNFYLGDFLNSAAKALNISGVTHVDSVPEDLNESEQLYFSRAGNLFNEYLHAENKFFDTSNIQGVLRQSGLQCPPINEANIIALMRYAMQQHFGMDLPRLARLMSARVRR
jgi:nucleoside-diphosphate-sugar epimerase